MLHSLHESGHRLRPVGLPLYNHGRVPINCASRCIRLVRVRFTLAGCGAKCLMSRRSAGHLSLRWKDSPIRGRCRRLSIYIERDLSRRVPVAGGAGVARAHVLRRLCAARGAAAAGRAAAAAGAGAALAPHAAALHPAALEPAAPRQVRKAIVGTHRLTIIIPFCFR